MKTLLFICGLALLTPALFYGQDLIVRYDYVTDEISFWDTAGHRLRHPAVKKDAPVLFQIVNFNNYVLAAKVHANKIEQNIPTGSINNIFSGLPELTPPAQNLTAKISLPSGNNAESFKSMNAIPTSEEVEETEETVPETQPVLRSSLKKMNREFEQLNEEMASLESELVEIERKIINYKNSLLFSQYASDYIQDLKKKEMITTAQRRQLLDEMMMALFQKKSDQLDLNEVLSFFTTFEGSLKYDLHQFDKTSGKYLTKLDQLRALSEAFAGLSSDESETLIPVGSIRQSLRHGIDFSDKLQAFQDFSHSLEGAVNQLNIPELFNNIYRNYLEMKLNRFEYSFTAPAEGDEMVFEIDFFRKDSTGTLSTQPVKTGKVMVPVRGGIKVNTSIGLGFNNFFQAQQQYFYRDSTIMAEEGDKFNPVVATLIHFYPQTASRVSLGGSIGVGIPINGSFNSPSFMAGLSLFAGKSERIVLTAGLMGAKATRLGQGYRVGDRLVPGDFSIPTLSRYEYGYFFSASFNLRK